MFASRIARSIGTGALRQDVRHVQRVRVAGHHVRRRPRRRSSSARARGTSARRRASSPRAGRRSARAPAMSDAAQELAHRRHARASIQRASVERVAGVLADEAGRARDPVGDDVGAEAARLGDGLRAALHRRGQPALGVRERDDDLLVARPVSTTSPSSDSSYSPSETASCATETGIDGDAGHRLGRLRVRLEVDASCRPAPSASRRARDRGGVVLPGQAHRRSRHSA